MLLIVGIIESDDIAAVNLEIEKCLNFSKKCAMLVDNVKEKYDSVSEPTDLSFSFISHCAITCTYIHKSLYMYSLFQAKVGIFVLHPYFRTETFTVL